MYAVVFSTIFLSVFYDFWLPGIDILQEVFFSNETNSEHF